MSEMLTPALTPEEWAGREWYHGDEAWLRLKDEGVAVENEIVASPEGLHALAALALYGQPFGFTWDHVRHIRSIAETLPADTLRRVALEDLAGRMAALLPPRGTA